MHAIDFLRNPSKTPVRPVYAVFGDDAFLRRESLKGIVHRILGGDTADEELAVSRFAGGDAKLADVLDELRTLPFFTKQRVVIVDDADPFVSAHRKELEEYVQHPAPGTLVLSVKVWSSSTRLAKMVEASGLALECRGPNERELTDWLVHLAKSNHGVQLDDDATILLLELVGPEVGLLVAELEKLAVFVGDRRRIHRDDVAKMVGAGRIETVWNALEAATTGRGDLALEHLDGLLAAGEHPVGLLAAMSSSLLKVHHSGRLRRARMDLREACRIAGVYYGAFETTQRQHAHLGPKRVDRIPELLLKADLDLKGSSQLSPRTVLETLFVELSRPRED